PNEHWHTDVSYINIAGTFYYLCSVLDGYSRAIIHWDSRFDQSFDLNSFIGRIVWNAGSLCQTLLWRFICISSEEGGKLYLWSGSW
ncbi:MAG: DDE-type integrase/transposase/recombinase, partial [Phycisphaerae bacterium]